MLTKPEVVSRISGQEARMEGLLTVSGVSSGYGDIAVLDNVSIEVAEREIVSAVGANSAVEE